MDNPIIDKVLENVVNPEPKGAEPTNPTPKKKEIVFDELDDDVKAFIDQQRTQASRTAREKALRDAVKDPEIKKAIRTEIEEEAKLSAEEKVRQREQQISLRENRIEAREKLIAAGITGEGLVKVLDFVVTDDKDTTLSKTETFVNTFTAMVASAAEAKTKELIKQTPKPKTNVTVPKEFKEMTFEERKNLMETDPARYKAELAKITSRI